MSKTIEHAKSPLRSKWSKWSSVEGGLERRRREVVERASETHHHITGLDVLHSTAVVRDGKIVEYHVDVKLAYITKPARIED